MAIDLVTTNLGVGNSSAPDAGRSSSTPSAAAPQQPAPTGEQQSSPPAVGLPAGADQDSNVDDAVKAINDYVQNIKRSLNFSVDEESGRTIIKVIDSETGEEIRQIPPESVLSIAKHIEQSLKGLLLKADA